MLAIYKRDFKAYFTNMIGYLVVAVLYMFISLFFTVYNISSGYPIFGYALMGMVTYLMIIIPFLTMRSLSEDRRTKTDQLWLTAPVSVTSIVLAKYFAMVSVVAIPLAASLFFPIFLSMNGGTYLGIDLLCVAVFLLISATYIAIGLFISSLTENQIIAAVISFGVFFFMAVISGISSMIPSTAIASALCFAALFVLLGIVVWRVTKSSFLGFLVTAICLVAELIVYLVDSSLFEGAFASLLGVLPFADALSYYVYGILDVASIVKDLSIIIFFLFLTVQSIQKRRWS